MKKIYPVSSLLNPRKLRSVLSFGIKGYLAEIGWFVAHRERASVDAHNEAIPWFTYSFIDFLEGRLTRDQHIFEYGSGNSTRYFAKRVKAIHSLEHDKSWHETGLRNKPVNAELIYCDLDQDGQYCRAAQRSKQPYHIIIVDGRDRVNCCKHSIEALTDDGVIILDDSERSRYEGARTALLDRGFREISFSGISPGFFYRKETAVFYRSNNCLGI